MRMSKHPRQSGFTLIELMIAVAVIAILSAIAIPSYQDHVRKTRRADAESVLMSARQAMERYYSKNYTYVGAAAGTDFSATSPADGGTAFYNIAFSAGPTATTYTLTATPAGAQVGDSCGNLTLSSLGQKGAKGATTAAVVNECW